MEEKKNKLQGLLYVLDQLLLLFQEANGRTKIRSLISIDEALEYFLAFQSHFIGTQTKYLKSTFREVLLHETDGLRVNIFRCYEGLEYFALRPHKVDLAYSLISLLWTENFAELVIGLLLTK